ncbi:anti-sigma factor family protein [Veillonella magna]|uniref:anti-sigma factor family protein n=1 Tax=Veillonella magna TaxID=464322 RepID=UPI000412292E|nr:zf-HC2 domain-containing protein [Veillonella magna]
MTCDTCRAQLNAYYDNELDAVERIAVEGHLHECLGCRDALADIAAVSALVQEAMPLPEVDDEFTAAVMAQIEQLEAKKDMVLPAAERSRYVGALSMLSTWLTVMAAVVVVGLLPIVIPVGSIVAGVVGGLLGLAASLSLVAVTLNHGWGLIWLVMVLAGVYGIRYMRNHEYV